LVSDIFVGFTNGGLASLGLPNPGSDPGNFFDKGPAGSVLRSTAAREMTSLRRLQFGQINSHWQPPARLGV
jgi:hypothetical protein